MLQSYLKIDSVLNAAQNSISKDNVKSVGEKAGAPLYSKSEILLEHVALILRQLDDTTIPLCRGSKPTMHTPEPFTAGLTTIIDNLDEGDQLKPIANILKVDMLNRRISLFAYHPILELWVQASCFPHLIYKSVAHSSKLGGDSIKKLY